MWIIVALLFVVGSLILYLVFVPVNLRIDTDLQAYELSQANTFSMSLHPSERPVVNMSLFGIQLPAFEKKTAVKKSEAEPKATKTEYRIRRSPRAWKFLIKEMIAAFRVKRLICTVDCKNVVWNARLVPLLWFLSRGPVQLNTNFTGRYYLQLELQLRLNRFLWAFFGFLIKK